MKKTIKLELQLREVYKTMSFRLSVHKALEIETLAKEYKTSVSSILEAIVLKVLNDK